MIFQGPDRFITPSWYPTKAETGRVVPTWNYAVVHVHGPLRLIHDRDWLRRHLGELTDTFEANRQTPWRISDAPVDYIDAQLGGLVGIEIPIGRLEGKWKVSQNKSEEDWRGVIDGLEREGDPAAQEMAALIRKSRR